MGANHSLNCSGKSKKRRKKKKNKKLNEDIEKHNDKIAALRTTSADMSQKISPADRELLENQIRDIEKRYSELRSKSGRHLKKYNLLGDNLGEIRHEVDDYISWLEEKEKELKANTPSGYTVKEAAEKLKKQKEILAELESKQNTIEGVMQKSEQLFQDLPKKEREVVEKWISSINDEHQRVYKMALEEEKLLSENVGHREIFQSGMDRVSKWLLEKEAESEKLDSLRLPSSEFEKQMEKCKSLLGDVSGYQPNIESLKRQVAHLEKDCSQENAEELKEKIEDIDTKYEEVKKKLSDQLEYFHNHLPIRKLHEKDAQRIDRWCKETEMKLATEPALDCAMEVLQDQYQHYQSLNNTAQIFESLVNETQERGNLLHHHLYEPDKFKLDEQTKEYTNRHAKVADTIKKRLQQLEAAMTDRSQVMEEVGEAQKMLATIQEALKQTGQPLGREVENVERTLRDIEDVGEKMSSYQPMVLQLNQTVERLRTAGQTAEAEEILRVTTQYEMLEDQIDQQCKKCRQAINLRQQYTDKDMQLETLLKETEDSINEVSQSSMTLPTKIERLKEVATKLSAADPLFLVMNEKGQQLAMDCNTEDSQKILADTHKKQEDIEQLRKILDRKIKQCELIQKNHDESENTVNEAIVWLEQKEDVLASCLPLDLDPDMIDHATDKHKALAREAIEKLDLVKDRLELEKAHYQKMEEPLPKNLAEKLEQIGNLEESIQNAIAKKEAYLSEAKADRLQLNDSMRQITDWIAGAEEMLDSGYDGLDYDTLNDTLSEHKDYFSEATMCQDEMEQVMELSERLLPTLDNNDKETLRQTLKNTNQKLATVMTASQRKQEELENKTDDWKDYQDSLYTVSAQMQDLEEDWAEIEQMPVASPEQLQQHLLAAQEFAERIEELRPAMAELNDLSRDLDREATSSSRALITQGITEANDRWKNLVCATENKQITLQDLNNQWQEYTTLVGEVENLVQDVEQSLPVVDADTESTPTLVSSLSDVKDAKSKLEVFEPKIEALKKVAQSLQKSLPTAEAKVHAQEHVMELLEKLERTQDIVSEQEAVLTEEIEDRQVFLASAEDAKISLQEAKTDLSAMHPGKEVTEVMEKMERQKVLKQNLAHKLDQAKHLGQVQVSKYSSKGKDLPIEIQQQIIDMESLESDVNAAMDAKQQELQHLAEDREEVTSLLKDVSAWLNEADLRLQGKIINIPDCQQKHEALLAEFGEFQKVLDKFRSKGGHLIQHTSDPIEKHIIQKAIADTSKHWLDLQGKAVDRSRQLDQAEHLNREFQQTADKVKTWLQQAEEVARAKPHYGNLEQIEDQLKQHRRLARDIEYNKGCLNHMGSLTKQMDKVCDGSLPKTQLQQLSSQLYNMMSSNSQKLHELEEVAEEIEDFENELAGIRSWMEETRMHLTMRDASIPLKDQLMHQEEILEDIEKHKGKALLIQQKQQELKKYSGDAHPEACNLAHDITQMQQAAREQCSKLKEAVTQQTQYEHDLKELTSAINDAQEKLRGSPVHPSDVNSLKKQITEHNTLAAKIKTYQQRVNEINDKNHDLAEKMLQLGPEIDDRLCELGIFPSTLGGYKVHVHHGGKYGSPCGMMPQYLQDSISQTLSDLDSGQYSDHPGNKSGHFSVDSASVPDSMVSDSLKSIHEGITPTTFEHTHAARSTHAADFEPHEMKLDLSSLAYPSKSDLDSGKSSSLHSMTRSKHSPMWPSGSTLADHDDHTPGKRQTSSLADDASNQGKHLSWKSLSSVGTNQKASPHDWKPKKLKPALMPYSETDMSASVPNLLQFPTLTPRERSASFGTRSTSPKKKKWASHHGLATGLKDLNDSWSNLQTQLGVKEQELQTALHKQQRYQQCVQDVNNKMEKVQNQLTKHLPASLNDLDRHLQEYRDALQDIEHIKDDIRRVDERGRQMGDVSDPEGYRAMQSTLAMLNDRVSNLQNLAETKGRKLQTAVKNKEKHNIALGAYNRRIGDLEKWLEEMKIRQATTPLPTDSVESLQQNLHENQLLQEEVNKKLQLISDLALQCDNLCEHETPQRAEKLRNQLANLQTELGALKLASIEKQGPLRTAIKEAERRKREMDEYECNVKKLQKWVNDTKQLILSPPNVESLVLPESNKELQQKLNRDISQHQKLVHRLGQETSVWKQPLFQSSQEPASLSEDELNRKWKKLSKELAEKRNSLRELVHQDSVDGSRPYSSTRWRPSSSAEIDTKDIAKVLSKLNGLWRELQGQVEDRQMRLDKALEYQQKYQEALQGVSSWLDLAERKLFEPESDGSLRQQVRDNEALQQEIRQLQQEIGVMEQKSQDLMSSVARGNQDLVEHSLRNLNDRVRILEKQAENQGQRLNNIDEQWRQYQDELKALRQSLSEVRASVANSNDSSSLNQLISEMQKIEAQLKRCEKQLEEVKRKGEELSSSAPQMVNMAELLALQSSYKDLQQKVMEKKADLLQSVSVQEQYEKMLADYEDFLETAQDKLKTDTITAQNLDQLRDQLIAHKSFFADLEVHCAMLDSLANQLDPSEQHKYATQHSKLTNLTYVVQDQASLRGQKLDRLVKQWSDIHDKQRHLDLFLDAVEEDLPKSVSSGDSMAVINDKKATFQYLQQQMTNEKPTLHQFVDKGKQLLHVITCPALESSIADVGERWVNLSTQITHELKKTENINDNMQIFEEDNTTFKSWLIAAKKKLSEIKNLSEHDLHSIAAVRAKVDKLLEFKKDVEQQQPRLKKLTQITKQLDETKSAYDANALKTQKDWLEEQWAALQHDISKAEEDLHQAQMDLMPSRQALHDLATWIRRMERALKEENEREARNLADIEIKLKSYKDFKIELQNRQMTVDFVNQSSLQSHGEDAPSTDKTDFAERLGTLNRHLETLNQDVSSKMRHWETLHNKAQDYERALTRVQDWFHEQEDKLKRYRLIGQEVSIKQTIKECMLLQRDIDNKTEDMEHVKSIGKSLMDYCERDSPDCQRCVQESLQRLERHQKHLNEQVEEVQRVLKDVLSQWEAYHKELQSANQVISEVEYCLGRYNLVGGDITTLRVQVEKLKSLLTTVEKEKRALEKLIALGNQLLKVCEPSVRQEIQQTLADVQSQWRKTCTELTDRTARFEDCLQQWQQYEEEYMSAKRWLDNKERQCNELVAMREDSSRREECLQKTKSLQKELDNFQAQISSLYHLSDAITKNMDSVSVVGIMSRQSSTEARVLALQQLIGKQIELLQGDLSHVLKFRELQNTLTMFLERADKILSKKDLDKSTDIRTIRARHQELRKLSNDFNDNAGKLDTLNDLGYRMALSEESSLELRELNHKFNRLQNNVKEMNKTLQGLLLIQQDFTEKCDEWKAFLAQTEHDLSTEIAGNLPDLMQQQRKCEKFQSDIYSQQQILHSIISDGNRMLEEDKVGENREGFRQKLNLLSDQWQAVLFRAKQRKDLIDAAVNQWQSFNDLTDRLCDCLMEKELELNNYGGERKSLQKIRNLLDKAMQNQFELQMQDDNLLRMKEMGSKILEIADPSGKREVTKVTSQLEKRWLDVNEKLESNIKTLSTALHQWRECDEEIEEILQWLKQTRKSLNSDLPSSYDELQAELNKCKDIKADFAASEGKRQTLLAKERQLSEMLQPEDMNVLHQRICLLNKLWDELYNQSSLRIQSITDNTGRWTSFSGRVKDFIDWMDKMEEQVMSTKDCHIEELLRKLQKDFVDEIAQKEVEKNRLLDQGGALKQVSSEMRADDIEARLLRLEEKWQHLVSVLGFRERKLQETVLAVQQLDVSMANLRKWLSGMEGDLTTPIIYQSCDRAEIQHKLQQQQELQHDIEHHSAGVGSVLNLCEVLLHDGDACPTPEEVGALQSAMQNLERRWRDICQLSPERRRSINETWDLWQNLIDDCHSFSTWLTKMEGEVNQVMPEIQSGQFTREKLKKLEEFQKKVHENLGKLESINSQYRRLAREGRTDHSNTLKGKMQDANNRWDKLQQQVSSASRRLKHSPGMRDDFATLYSSLHSWLTDLDIRINDLEHRSHMDYGTKITEVKGIQDEISSKLHTFERLDQATLFIMQHGDSLDAIRVQTDSNDLKRFSRRVFERADRLQADLLNAQLDEPDAGEFMPEDLNESLKEIEEYLEASPPESPPEKRRASGLGILERRSVSPVLSRRSPINVHHSQSPLRDRHSPEGRRSRSPTRGSSPSRFANRSPIRSPRTLSPARSLRSVSPSGMTRSLSPFRATPRRSRSPRHFEGRQSPVLSREERWRRLQQDVPLDIRESDIEGLLGNLVDALQEAKDKLHDAEMELYSPSLDRSFDEMSNKFTQCMSECEKAIELVKRFDRRIKYETGLSSIPSADNEVLGVLKRWERIQAQALETSLRLSQKQQDWSQFRTDVNNMLTWLDKADTMQRLHANIPHNIVDLDSIIREHRTLEKDFLLQLEAKKARVLSINLISKNFLHPPSEETYFLRQKLQLMNDRWDATCAFAAQLQKELQVALMQCQEFHHTIHDLMLWLEKVETKLQQNEPINLGADESILYTKLKRLKEIRGELEANQPRVMSLRETADQLLINTDSTEMVNAKDKMHIISNRLRALLRLSNSYIVSLEDRLHTLAKKSEASSPVGDLSRESISDSSFGLPSNKTSTPRSPRNITGRGSPMFHHGRPSPLTLSRRINRTS